MEIVESQSILPPGAEFVREYARKTLHVDVPDVGPYAIDPFMGVTSIKTFKSKKETIVLFCGDGEHERADWIWIPLFYAWYKKD